jgi:NTP pyrophosphatase (non-canonical NTP hydrolase)
MNEAVKYINPTQEFWFRHSAWSQLTFGSDAERGPLGALKHLEREAREAQLAFNAGLSQDMQIEIADCLFLTFDAARRAGLSLDNLLDIAFAKLEKNQKRVWAKPTKLDEPIEHVRGIHD